MAELGYADFTSASINADGGGKKSIAGVDVSKHIPIIWTQHEIKVPFDDHSRATTGTARHGLYSVKMRTSSADIELMKALDTHKQLTKVAFHYFKIQGEKKDLQKYRTVTLENAKLLTFVFNHPYTDLDGKLYPPNIAPPDDYFFAQFSYQVFTIEGNPGGTYTTTWEKSGS